MTETCPFCDESVAVSASSCPHCGHSFEPPPEQKYGRPVEVLRRALLEVKGRRLPLERMNQVFSHLSGAVQQVLDSASEDLESNFKSLREAESEVPEDARKSVTEFIDDFEELQEEVNESLLSISEVFGEVSSLEQLRAREGELDAHMAKLQSSVDALGHLHQETSLSVMTEIPDDPIPDEVSIALDHFELAMEALVTYMETSRDLEDISLCIKHTDQARVQLARLMLMDTMSG